MKKKGSIFLSMIMMFVIYLFAVGLVVVFFYFFKFHISITIIDEYRWNKVQEVPLSLLSMDVEGESFVTKVNKIYYKFEPEDKLDEVKEMVNKQLYFVFGDEPPNMGYILTIGEITVTQSKKYPDCKCEPAVELVPTLKCQGGCGDKEGASCVGGYTQDPITGIQQPIPDPTKC